MPHPIPHLAPTAPRIHLRAVRCVCDHCGAHVIARASYTLGGSCGNCGSYELTALAAAPRPAAAPAWLAA